MRRSVLVMLLALVPLAAGCSGKQKIPDPVPIGGKVNDTKGKDLVLTFHPQDEINKSQVGLTFVVDGKTGQLREGKGIEGRYKITVALVPAQGAAPSAGGGPGEGAAALLSGIPPQLRDAKSSPLEVTIPSEGNTRLEITIPW